VEFEKDRYVFMMNIGKSTKQLYTLANSAMLSVFNSETIISRMKEEIINTFQQSLWTKKRKLFCIQFN